ncbi:DUF1223 domain-containing protein [Vitreimonas sp.]|jgi:hypothetical protein|uniref:DUF1223 domain-containing protein n=1 Tax=Vitreimonas sp. TaxID=3069702 RepID=UPI002EDA79C4
MLPRMIARFLAALLFGLAATTLSAHAQVQGQRVQTVVELYTAQGCTQCPRANRLLGGFSREDGVLALTFPVGIWDYLGWPDTFAQREFSDRQRDYSNALRVRGRFTPQLVFDGARQISASDWDEARATFDQRRAAGLPAIAPDLSISRLNNGRVRVTVGARAGAPESDIWLVAYEPGPISVRITGGMNVNRTVTHYNLVRRIDRLAQWNGASAWYERSLCSPHCAVIVQERYGGPVLAAAYVER